MSASNLGRVLKHSYYNSFRSNLTILALSPYQVSYQYNKLSAFTRTPHIVSKLLKLNIELLDQQTTI